MGINHIYETIFLPQSCAISSMTEAVGALFVSSVVTSGGIFQCLSISQVIKQNIQLSSVRQRRLCLSSQCDLLDFIIKSIK